MKKSTIWLIAATSLVLVGSIVFEGVMTMLKWDFTKLSTVKYESSSYELNEEYKDILIESDTADIDFVPAEDTITKVVCYEQKNITHKVEIKDGALKIIIDDNRRWYDHIGIGFNTSKITVYMPKAEYGKLSVKNDTGDIKIPDDYKFQSIEISQSTGDTECYAPVKEHLKIKTSTGHIKLKNMSAKSVNLSVSTGDIALSKVECEGELKIKVSTGDAKLTDVNCKNLVSSGRTGDISLENTIAKEGFSIERSTGDVKFKKCDAQSLDIKTDTGSVKGTLRSEKVFITNSDTGSISVPHTTSGGKCEITTDTGNIKIEIEP